MSSKTNPAYGAGRTHVINLRVTQEEFDWIREFGDREERSISSVLRLALRALVEAQDKGRS